MSSYRLAFSFDIDNDELADCSPQECFVLGYELATVVQACQDSAYFANIVHAKNQARIKSTIASKLRHYRMIYLQDDISEEWMYLEIQSLDGKWPPPRQ